MAPKTSQNTSKVPIKLRSLEKVKGRVLLRKAAKRLAAPTADRMDTFWHHSDTNNNICTVIYTSPWQLIQADFCDLSTVCWQCRCFGQLWWAVTEFSSGNIHRALISNTQSKSQTTPLAQFLNGSDKLLYLMPSQLSSLTNRLCQLFPHFQTLSEDAKWM